MSSVLIDDRLIVTAVRTFLQSFIHTADIFSRFPEAVIICSDKDKLALDVLDLYHLFFGVLSCLFRVDKQFCAACYIARALGFLFYYAIIFGMLINEGHISDRLAFP